APPLSAIIVLATSLQGRRRAVGRFLGGVSYPFYLYHWVGAFGAHFIEHRLGRTLAWEGWLAYLFAVAAGSTAYLLIDQNVMRLRSGLYQPRAGTILMLTAYTLLTMGIVAGAVLRLGV
ncbi:MAG: acyltransferase, partial [Sphingomonas sp.]